MDGKLPLGSENYKEFDAMMNEKLILEVARVLKSMGDVNIEVEREIKIEDGKQELQRQISLKDYFASGLGSVFDTIDVVLEWLEYAGKKTSENIQLQKKEGVLRGLYHFTALGSYASFLGLLELACKFLDIPENPYQAKREHIRKCLSEVEEQKKDLFQLVKEAGDLLQSITRQPEFDHAKATEFDNVVRQSKDVIESCKGLLATAEVTINELIKYMNIMKWFSRGLRVGGLVLTCYGLYHLTPSSSSLETLESYLTPSNLDVVQKICFDSKLNNILMVAACTASGYAWMSLYPSRAYALRDSLVELSYQHLRLTKGLDGLERKIISAVDMVDNLRREQSTLHNRKDTCI